MDIILKSFRIKVIGFVSAALILLLINGGLGVFATESDWPQYLRIGLFSLMFLISLVGLFLPRSRNLAIGALTVWALIALGFIYVFITVLLTGNLM